MNHYICFNEVPWQFPKDTIWPIEPHTCAKHQILRKYLDAWLPILGTYNKRIVYIDGFAGPGEYKGGEPGSPIIALEAARIPPGELGRRARSSYSSRSDQTGSLTCRSRIATLQLPGHVQGPH